MTTTPDPSSHLAEQSTSVVPRGEHPAISILEDDPSEQIRFGTTATLLETESDYGDFANDAEELEIIDSLLSEAENWQCADASTLLVTDIEDYEPPEGVRLPKILGAEQPSRPWEVSQVQVVQNSNTPNCMLYVVLLQSDH